MQPEKTDVVVVGGGLSGIACALGLAQQGRQVTLLESEPQLGGRAASWTDAKTGDPVHIGPHIFLSVYPNMWRLLDTLGTRHKVVFWDERLAALVVDGTKEHATRVWKLPAPFHLLPGVLLDPAMSWWDTLSNVPVTAWALQASSEELEALDARYGREFLDEMGVTDKYLDYFWAFTSMSILNLPLEDVSGTALLRFYRKLSGTYGVRIGFADGGLGELFAPAKGMLERLGSTVELGARVRAFLGEGDRVEGVELVDGRRLEAKAVVAALPPPALRPLLRHGWSERFPVLGNVAAFEPCPYISTYLWFDRKLTSKQFWARRFSPRDMNCDFYDFSNINSGWSGRPSFIGTNAILSSRLPAMSDDEVVRRTLAELAEYLPQAREAKLVHSVVNRIPMAIHQPRPGTERKRPPVAPGPSGLYLSGDWLGTGFPSSMEGAVLAGFRSAEAVLAQLGQTARLEAPHRDIDLSARLTGQLWNLLPTMRIPYWLQRMRKARQGSALGALAGLAAAREAFGLRRAA